MITQRTLSLFILYFFLGVQANIYDFAVRLDLQNVYMVPLSTMQNYYVIISIIWYFKWIPAITSDLVGFRGYHRKPYMVIANTAAFVFSMCLTIPHLPLSSYIALLTLTSISICVADVNYDACMVEDVRGSNGKQTMLTRIQLVRAFGGLVGNVTGPLVWPYIDSYGVFEVSAFISGFAALISAIVFIDYKREENVVSNAFGPGKGYDIQVWLLF